MATGKGFILLAVLLSVMGSSLRAEETEYNFQVGAELGEIAQSKLGSWSSDNYSLLLGQRFTSDRWEKFGWRFLAFNTDLKISHIESTARPNGWIQGNFNGLGVRQAANRLTFDYYPWEFRAGLFSFRPIVGLTMGNTVEEISSPRPAALFPHYLGDDSLPYLPGSRGNSDFSILYYGLRQPNPSESLLFLLGKFPFSEQMTRRASMVGGDLRLQLVLWDLVFVEEEINGGVQEFVRRRRISDTFINYPPSGIFHFWFNLGIYCRF